MSISTLVHQARLLQSCYQWAFQEPYHGNCQRLHFVPQLIQKGVRNVLHNGHWLMELWQSVIQLFSRSKQLSQQWMHPFLLLQFCWIHWVPHATACGKGTFVLCSSKGIQWSWGTYLLRGKIKQLLVECTWMLVEFYHTYHDFDYYNRYSCLLEVQLSLYLAVQTRHIWQSIQVTRRNSQNIWLCERSTRWLDQSHRILQASLLPFVPSLQNLRLNNNKKYNCCERRTNQSSGCCTDGLCKYSLSSCCDLYACKAQGLCGRSEAAMLSYHLGMDSCPVQQYSVAFDQATPMTGLECTDIISWRREFIFVTKWETIGSTSNRWYPQWRRCNGETENKGLSGSSSYCNLQRGLLEYELHLLDDYNGTRYSSAHLSPYAQEFVGLGNTLPQTTFHDSQINPALGDNASISWFSFIKQAL